MLQPKEIDDLRERSQKYAGALAVRELTEPREVDAVSVVLLKKAAQADPKLFGVALELAPNDPYTLYERLGGCYTMNRNNGGKNAR